MAATTSSTTLTPPNTLPKYSRKKVTLNTGAAIPSIGIGTFQDADEQEDAVYTALGLGYRHIDTAHNYGTEPAIARGIARAGVLRDEIFVTTKLWCNAHHPDDVEPALDESLRDLDTGYVDLYLMHYPCAFKRGQELLPFGLDGKIQTEPTDFIETWKAMEKLLATGKTRAIGVSNFSQQELQRVLDEGSVAPAAHQTELHPYLQQASFVHFHATHDIHIIQFSPCGNLNQFYRDVSWGKEVAHIPRLVDHPILQEIGKKYGKSPIQTALAWGVQHGRTVIPKSTIEWQIRENLEADFPLGADDIAKIAMLDQKARFNDPSANFGYHLYQGLDGAAAAA